LEDNGFSACRLVVDADSNSSYPVDKAIQVGRLMEQYKCDFYEEPVPFYFGFVDLMPIYWVVSLFQNSMLLLEEAE